MTEYKRVPNSVMDIRLNAYGDVKSFDPEYPDPRISLDSRGYHIFYARLNNKKRRSLSVHRTVAILFIDIPERLSKYDISELEVNHKNGDKSNNTVQNLEWVTKLENIKHAHENELFSNRTPVLVKCVEDGTVTRYRSVNLAALAHGLHSCDVREHVLREYAGCIAINGYMFKLDDDSEWSSKKVHPNAKQGLRLTYRVTGFDNLTKEEWLFNSIPDACNALGLNLSTVKYMNTKYGRYSSFDKRWVFTLHSLPTLLTPRRSVVSLNRETGEMVVYDSVRLTTKATGVPGLFLRGNIDGPLAGMIPWKGLYYKYNDGEEFPRARYLFPDMNHIGRTIKYVVFKEGDDTPYLIATVADICKRLKWDDSDYYEHRKKFGTSKAFRGLKIYNIDDIDLGNRG